MNALVGLGKLVALFFWLAVVANLVSPFAHPFSMLLKVVGALILVIHVIELLAFGSRLRGRRHAWLDGLQVLLFGVFHLLSVTRSSSQGGSHA
ncbi:hypothetical protein D9M71_183990 [compost metagenome]